jgi:hypothetical protein
MTTHEISVAQNWVELGGLCQSGLCQVGLVLLRDGRSLEIGLGYEPGGVFEPDVFEDFEGGVGEFEEIADLEGLVGVAEGIEEGVGAGGFDGIGGGLVVFEFDDGGAGGVGSPAELSGGGIAEAMDLEGGH